MNAEMELNGDRIGGPKMYFPLYIHTVNHQKLAKHKSKTHCKKIFHNIFFCQINFNNLFSSDNLLF